MPIKIVANKHIPPGYYYDPQSAEIKPFGDALTASKIIQHNATIEAEIKAKFQELFEAQKAAFTKKIVESNQLAPSPQLVDVYGVELHKEMFGDWVVGFSDQSNAMFSGEQLVEMMKQLAETDTPIKGKSFTTQYLDDPFPKPPLGKKPQWLVDEEEKKIAALNEGRKPNQFYVFTRQQALENPSWCMSQLLATFVGRGAVCALRHDAETDAFTIEQAEELKPSW